MPFIFAWTSVLIACFIGAAVGFCKEWRKGPPPPTAIRWCRPSSTDPACVRARDNYERELAKQRYVREFMNPALSSQGAEPPP